MYIYIHTCVHMYAYTHVYTFKVSRMSYHARQGATGLCVEKRGCYDHADFLRLNLRKTRQLANYCRPLLQRRNKTSTVSRKLCRPS